MIKLGWLEKAREIRRNRLRRLLSYFGIAAFSQLNKTPFRHRRFGSRSLSRRAPYALAAWLRKGELEAAKVETGTFNGKGLKSDLKEIRSFSLLPPEEFVPRLVSVCVSLGVAVVLFRPCRRSYVSGAAYWLGDKPVIQLSLRFRTNDHLWFSFFHELGHIVLHGKKRHSWTTSKGMEMTMSGSKRVRLKNLIPDVHFKRL